MALVAGWQPRPVFITSTFRDMQAERDWLRNYVLPELEERLRARHHHLEPIDLRWGVDPETTDEAAEQSREFLVLKVCLEEVKRSRPFLIGLLGDRYGWVPPEDRMTAAADEAGFAEPVAGRSVTDLEIAFGVLSDPDQAQRSLLYLRAPLPYDDMPKEVAAEYSEDHRTDPSAAAAKTNLDALKERLRTTLPGQVHPYQAEWDKDKNSVVGLEAWGDLVFKYLWAALDAETAAYAHAEAPSWQEEERWVLEQFIEDRGRDFVGRDEILDELIEPATSPSGEGVPWGACVTGPAGTGKSALFAALHGRLRHEDILVLAHAAGIGPRSTQVDAMLRRWIEELSRVLGLDEPLADDATAADVEQAFHGLLGRVSTERRVVVLVDALNQFEPTTRARYLTWLPKLWPANARLIATAIPGAQSAALSQRPGLRTRELPPLSEHEAAAIARAVCARYHRTINPRVVQALLARRREDGRPAAGNPLWLELAVEALNLLDADDFARMDREFGGRPEERLHRLLLATVEQLPSDVAELYGWLLRRAERLHGERWARAFVNVIGVSRAGWRESDLRALMPQQSGEAWDDLKFAALRRTFRAHVVRRGAQAQWDFSHAQMREAVHRRSLQDEGEVKRIHTLIADHLLALSTDDPLHESETMVHLAGADDRGRAANYYGGALSDDKEAGVTAVLAERILAGQDEEPNVALDWTLTLLEETGIGDRTRVGLCRRFNFHLDNALENQTRLDARQVLLEGVLATLKDLTAMDPANAGWQQILSANHIGIGHLLMAQGDRVGAFESYVAAMEIGERLTQSEPENKTFQRVLSGSLTNIGDAQMALHDFAGALDCYRAAIEIDELPTQLEPDNKNWQRARSVAHDRISDALRAEGDLDGALEARRAAIEIAARLARADPANTGWQRDLSLNFNRLGTILSAQGDRAGALEAHRSAIGIQERLARAEPDNTDWLCNVAKSHSLIGYLLKAQGDRVGALEAYRAGMAIDERLTQADPANAEWQYDYSTSHSLIGEELEAHGDRAGALAAYRAAMEIRDRLVRAHPVNEDWWQGLSVSHTKIGNVLLAQRDRVGALAAYRAGMAIDERLVELDPANADRQRDLSVSHTKIGNVLLAQRDRAGALAAYRAGMAIAERLVESDPANADRQRDLSVSHTKIGNVLLAQRDRAGALAAYRAGMAIDERLVESDPANADRQRDLSVSHEKIGDTLLMQGNRAGALEAYRAGMAIDERLASLDPTNTVFRQQLTTTHFKIRMCSLGGLGTYLFRGFHLFAFRIGALYGEGGEGERNLVGN